MVVRVGHPLLLLSVLGENFIHYMDAFFPFLKLALQNYAAYQVHTYMYMYTVEPL